MSQFTKEKVISQFLRLYKQAENILWTRGNDTNISMSFHGLQGIVKSQREIINQLKMDLNFVDMPIPTGHSAVSKAVAENRVWLIKGLRVNVMGVFFDCPNFWGDKPGWTTQEMIKEWFPKENPTSIRPRITELSNIRFVERVSYDTAGRNAGAESKDGYLVRLNSFKNYEGVWRISELGKTAWKEYLSRVQS